MGVYINMEMPVFEHQSWDIREGADGKWYMVDTNAETSDGEWHEIVPVPPHYDLIDHNALKIAVMNCDCETRIDFLKHTMDCINKAPVVIPSDMPTYEEEE